MDSADVAANVGSKDVSCSPVGEQFSYSIQSTLEPPGSSPLSNALAPYPATSTATLPFQSSVSVPSPTYYHRTVPPVNGSTCAMVSSKTLYPSPFPLGYNDDGGDNYASVPQNYILPSNDAHAMNAHGVYSSHGSTRGWTPISHGTRGPGGPLFVEQSSPAFSNAHLPYLTSTVARTPSLATDGSYFPTMSALSSSLPTASSAADRLLPKPQQSTLNGSGPGVNGESLGGNPNGSGPHLSFKNAPQSWTSDGAPFAALPASARGTTVSTSVMVTAPLARAASASFSDSSQIFLPVSTSPVVGTASLPSLSYSSSASSTLTPPSNYPHCLGSTFPPTTCNEALLPSHNSSSNLYSFGSESGYRRTSQGESTASNDGTLVSGQQYTRLRQPQPPYPTSLDVLHRRSSADSRAPAAHRSSVGSYRA
ncbi:MAG: hypothetical protein M1838_006217 [Thelocarpon superellum]|nr:MAG: hypothetical protein M1838_006217 [Thelocarpon superellum]